MAVANTAARERQRRLALLAVGGQQNGHRTTIVSFKGIAGQQRPYLDWLLTQCLADGVAASDVVTEEAVALLAQRLGMPLQIEQYLTQALEEGWRMGEKPVTAQLVEALLSPQLDGLEPRLRRHGYDIPDLAEGVVNLMGGG